MIKAYYEVICVEFERKPPTTLLYLLQVLKYFMIDPLNIIFDDLGIWLLGYNDHV